MVKVDLWHNVSFCIKKLENPSQPFERYGAIINSILSLLITNKTLVCITETPQKYSLCYELSNPQKIKEYDGVYVVNDGLHNTEAMISDISQSEEFQRGLIRLLLLPQKQDDILNYLGSASIVFNRGDVKKGELVYMEADGQSIYWENVNDISRIDEVVSKLNY